MRTVKYWLECSRYYALPMSFFSWLIIFCYSLRDKGNCIYGILALIGIMSAHLATNLFDDYCDYKKLKKTYKDGNLVLPNTQRGKCKYILNGSSTPKEVLLIVCVYCFISAIIGGFFFLIYGKPLLYLIGLGAIIVLSYSFCSYYRMSEIIVGTAFGPLLFIGTNYVMTGHFSVESLWLSVPSMIFTINLLYTDTFLDKKIDEQEGKKTLANTFVSDESALFFQKIMLAAGYLSVIVLYLTGICNRGVFLTYITIPLSIDLIHSLKMYSDNEKEIPSKKWYHFPFEAWEDIKTNRSLTFMFRMYQARNLMIYVSLIITLSIFIK